MTDDERDMDIGKWVVISVTLTTWLFLVGFSLHYTIRSAPLETFIELATKIIQPLYSSTIAVVLSYVFGKPVVRAIAERLSRRSPSGERHE